MITEEKEELEHQMKIFVSKLEQDTLAMQRERDIRGRKSWPLFLLKIMIETLENGAPVTAVAKNLESAIRLIFPRVEIVELHNVNHARKKHELLFECLEKY